MKTKLMMALVASTMLFGGQVMAGDTSSTSTSGSVAGAMASGGTTKNYGLANGGIGAALCADSVGTPIFSVSTSRRACEVMQGVAIMTDRGLLTKAEARAIGLKAIEMSGVKLVKDDKPAAAMPNITGDWKSLSRPHQRAIKECKALWNGQRVQGCTY